MTKEHVIVTGTGKCGTTFLIRLFTLLGLDTGFTRNSSIEQQDFKHTFIKNPKLSLSMKNIIDRYNIKLVIVPIRNIEECTQSRLRNFPRLSKSHEEITNENCKRLAILTQDLVTQEIPYIFLNFHKMTNPMVGSKYLYGKLECIINQYNVNFNTFNDSFIEAFKLSLSSISPD